MRYESPGTNGVVAWCLELHDLWISKAVAGRDKDREFCEALLRDGNVDSAKLLDRLTGVSELESAIVERIAAWVGSESGA